MIMNIKMPKWTPVVLLSLLTLLPKQILAYQTTKLLPPTRNYTIHGRIVDSFTNLPISNVKLTLLSADSTAIDLYMERQSCSSRLLFLYAKEFE